MARRRRRTFSPEFKAEAVRLVDANAVPLATIAQQLGVGRTTLCGGCRRHDRSRGKR